MLIFSDRVKANEYGVRMNHIRSVVASPDQTQVLTTPDGERDYYLYSREVTEVEPHRHLVVMTEPRDRDEVVMGVHPVPSGIVLLGDEPTMMLRKLANAFGHTIEVGNTRAKFIVSDEVPMPSGKAQVLNIVGAPKDHELDAEFMIKKTNGTVQVLLAFVIDVTALKERLGID